MSMLDKSCNEFVEVLASKAPVPGGGGAAAFGGAIGMALGNMVGSLTVGKKKYADVEGEVKELLEKGYAVIEDLKGLVAKDAEVFEPLSQAYGLPKDTPEQLAHKEEVLEKCAIEACSVPMDILRKTYEGIKLTERMAQIGSLLVISDAGCSIVFLKAALESAMMNVVINLGIIKDQDYVNSTREEMNRLLADGRKVADETFALVMSKIDKSGHGQ